MANLTTIRNALAAVISAALPNVNVSPFYVQQVNPPQIVIDTLPLVEEYATFDGSADFGLRLMLLASAGDDASGQGVLDGWLASDGAGSVLAAIQANPRLNNTVDYCVIQRVGGGAGAARGGYGLIDWAGVLYVGTMVFLEIAASQQ